MHIGFNKFQSYGKMMLIFIVSMIVMVILFYPHPIRFSTPATAPQKVFLYFIVFLIFIGFVSIILQLCFQPKCVDIFEEEKYIVVSFWILKSITIPFDSFANYSFIIIVVKSTLKYKGIVVEINSGMPLFFSNINLEDYTPIQSLMEKLSIRFEGNKDFNLFTYCNRFLKAK